MTTAKVKVGITISPELLNDIRTRVSSSEVRSVSALIQRPIKGQIAAE